MENLSSHLRKTFLAGIFAAVPVVVTAVAIWYIDDRTRVISEKLLGRSLPFVGIVVAVVALYFAGLIATSLLGKWLVGLVDRILCRIPVFKQLYSAWKQIALTPGGGEGIFARVVLVAADSNAAMRQLGFTSGQTLDADSDLLCVFVPNAPNPVQGRLLFVHRSMVQFTDMTAENAFKLILSTGNYLPPELSAACNGTGSPPRPLAVY